MSLKTIKALIVKPGEAPYSHTYVCRLYFAMEFWLKYGLACRSVKVAGFDRARGLLIAIYAKFSPDSVRHMADTVRGSFSFSILDDRNTIWLIKGDSPLSIPHFPEKKIYVYASTDEILYKSCIDLFLFEELKKGRFEEVSIKNGDIMQIRSDGINSSNNDYNNN